MRASLARPGYILPSARRALRLPPDRVRGGKWRGPAPHVNPGRRHTPPKHVLRRRLPAHWAAPKVASPARRLPRHRYTGVNSEPQLSPLALGRLYRQISSLLEAVQGAKAFRKGMSRAPPRHGRAARGSASVDPPQTPTNLRSRDASSPPRSPERTPCSPAHMPRSPSSGAGGQGATSHEVRSPRRSPSQRNLGSPGKMGPGIDPFTDECPLAPPVWDSPPLRRPARSPGRWADSPQWADGTAADSNSPRRSPARDAGPIKAGRGVRSPYDHGSAAALEQREGQECVEDGSPSAALDAAAAARRRRLIRLMQDSPSEESYDDGRSPSPEDAPSCARRGPDSHGIPDGREGRSISQGRRSGSRGSDSIGGGSRGSPSTRTVSAACADPADRAYSAASARMNRAREAELQEALRGAATAVHWGGGPLQPRAKPGQAILGHHAKLGQPGQTILGRQAILGHDARAGRSPHRSRSPHGVASSRGTSAEPEPTTASASAEYAYSRPLPPPHAQAAKPWHNYSPHAAVPSRDARAAAAAHFAPSCQSQPVSRGRGAPISTCDSGQLGGAHVPPSRPDTHRSDRGVNDIVRGVNDIYGLRSATCHAAPAAATSSAPAPAATATSSPASAAAAAAAAATAAAAAATAAAAAATAAASFSHNDGAPAPSPAAVTSTFASPAPPPSGERDCADPSQDSVDPAQQCADPSQDSVDLSSVLLESLRASAGVEPARLQQPKSNLRPTSAGVEPGGLRQLESNQEACISWC